MLCLIWARLSKCWKEPPPWSHDGLGLNPFVISSSAICFCLVADMKTPEMFVLPLLLICALLQAQQLRKPGCLKLRPPGSIWPWSTAIVSHISTQNWSSKQCLIHLYNSRVLPFVIAKQISSWSLIDLRYRILFCLMPTDERSLDGELLFRKLQTDTQCQSHGNHSGTMEPLWLHYCKSALYYLG